MSRLAWIALAAQLAVAAELPAEWIDPDAGHCVIRLSREDGTQSLYFHQNAYSADGRKLIVTTRGGGIAAIDLADPRGEAAGRRPRFGAGDGPQNR